MEMPSSNPKEELCKLLKKRGYISDFKRFKEKDKAFKSLHIDLRYFDNNLSAIAHLQRVSKPGVRFYSSWQDLPISKGGKGFLIVSTSQGIMDSKDARKRHLGGEVWCEVF